MDTNIGLFDIGNNETYGFVISVSVEVMLKFSEDSSTDQCGLSA